MIGNQDRQEIRLKRRPFPSRLWRHYRCYRDMLHMPRAQSFRFAWRLARTKRVRLKDTNR